MLFLGFYSNSEIDIVISGADVLYILKASQSSTQKSWVAPLLVLTKLYLAHVVELIRSLKKHVLILGTKSFPWKADKKM